MCHEPIIAARPITLLLPSRAGAERLVEKELERCALRLGWPSASTRMMITAVEEACLNAMEHGNAWRDDLTVRVTIALPSSDHIHVEVTDAAVSDLPTSRLSLHAGWDVISSFSSRAFLYTDLASQKTTAALDFYRLALP